MKLIWLGVYSSIVKCRGVVIFEREWKMRIYGWMWDFRSEKRIKDYF